MLYIMSSGGYKKKYKYPVETPHWTTLLKKLINDTNFKGKWSVAIKKLWIPFKKSNDWRKLTKQNTKTKPKQERKQEPKQKLELELEPEKDEIVKRKIDGNEWFYYGNFGVNQTGYEEYYNYIKKLFTSPGKVSDSKWEEIQKLRKNFYDNQTASDYFPTPKKVVDRIMKYIQEQPYLKRMINKDNKVHLLEPSAGTGSIIKGYIENFGFDTDKITANEYRKDNLLSKLLDGVKITTMDFLKMPTKEDYDLIIMNPPFNAEGRKDYFIEHIVHGINMLSRGGVMIVLCPEFHDSREQKTTASDLINKDLKENFLYMTLENSKKMTEPMKKRLYENGDTYTYEKEGKSHIIELRQHQISLLGYTNAEFDKVSHEKKRDVYSLKSLGMKIAIYEISIA